MKAIKTTINAMASQWRNRVPPQEKRGAGTNEVCPHCGAQSSSSRLSLREMILAAVSGSLLLLILVPAVWVAEQWIENQGHRILDPMTWRRAARQLEFVKHPADEWLNAWTERGK